MKKGHFINQIQTMLGVTKNEIYFVTLILVGLIIGTSIKFFSQDDSDYINRRNEIYRALDSLAEVNKSSYVGTDLKGNPDTELALGDTIIPKEKTFPSRQKKELPSGKININTASITELMKLPGVGEATAQKIIEYRKNNPFNKPEDIMNVKGIGEKKFEKMKPYIVVK
ncbi:MAG: helix-hairpin-helix domain-containing protein [Candidatus Kapabacteria bacterium]|nr:helix-hairpin-helix domain-containing protein [Candidatus Kapabacteria bacterium]